MLQDFQMAIDNHPDSVSVSYSSTVFKGILESKTEKIYQEDGSYFLNKSFELSVITVTLPAINIKTTPSLTIGSISYKIKSIFPESSLLTKLFLELA